MPGGGDARGDGGPRGVAVLTGAADRVAAVRARIAQAAHQCGRDPATITLIAASKTQPASAVAELRAAGVSHFGENYVQELVAKAESLDGPTPHWHFIGHLQRNKVKQVLPWIAALHTVDSTRLANRVNTVAKERTRPLPVLLQVNIGGESSKDGVPPSAVSELAEHVARDCPHLALRGLMTVPPPGDPERWLSAMQTLRDDLAERLGQPLPDLSMGMSGDLEVAIRYGATYVRVGSALFGERK